MPEPFAPFAARLTRGYVCSRSRSSCWSSQRPACWPFCCTSARSTMRSASYAQRVTERARSVRAPARAAERIRAAARRRDRRRASSASASSTTRTVCWRRARVRRTATGLRASRPRCWDCTPRSCASTGGTIVIAPDLAGFARLLSRYLSVVVPVGALAVLAAWLIGPGDHAPRHRAAARRLGGVAPRCRRRLRARTPPSARQRPSRPHRGV